MLSLLSMCRLLACGFHWPVASGWSQGLEKGDLEWVDLAEIRYILLTPRSMDDVPRVGLTYDSSSFSHATGGGSGGGGL